MIEKKLLEMINNGDFPSANYSLITPNNKYIGSVGNRSLYPSIEVNSINTLYDMASLTKVVVTNTIISRMLDKKIISLNDLVCSYLPRFKHKNIKIIDFLTHSSGLPADLKPDINLNKEEYINQIYDLDLIYVPHSKVIYSDIGFIILGFMIENIYQKKLDEVAKQEVFIPLNMSDSCFNPKDKKLCAPTEVTEKRGVVRGVVHDEKAYVLGGTAGHAGLFSTIKDITNFCEMILNNGYFNGKRYLSKDIINLYYQPLIIEDKNRYRTVGWIVGSKATATGNLGSMDTIFHLGFTGTSIIIDRNKIIASILLTNRIHPTRENIKIYKSRPEFYKTCNDVYEIDKNLRGNIK